METNDLILSRMQRLLCLGLEGQPAAELIEATATIWQETLANYSPNRLARAFDAVERSCTRWPAPADVIANLPPYMPPEPERRPERIIERERTADEIAEQKATSERARAAIAECAAKLGVFGGHVRDGE